MQMSHFFLQVSSDSMWMQYLCFFFHSEDIIFRKTLNKPYKYESLLYFDFFSVSFYWQYVNAIFIFFTILEASYFVKFSTKQY